MQLYAKAPRQLQVQHRQRHALSAVMPSRPRQAAQPSQAASRAVHITSSLQEAAAASDTSRRSLLLSSALLSLLSLEQALPAALAAAGITKVFVAGSTGQTGRRVVQQLRAKGFEVRAGVRDIKKGQGLGLAMDKSVELVEADVLKPDQLAAAIGDAQAVICATGYTGFNPSGFGEVDEVGTKNLINAAKAAGVTKFVLVSSLLTNAVEVGQKENPNFKFLNIFGNVLDHKNVAERYLRASGLNWTIVRPGGLSNDPPAKVGNLIVGKEDTLFGLDTDPGREISRDTVAEVLVAALQQPSADNKVVEIVSNLSAPPLSPDQYFP